MNKTGNEVEMRC